jgi:hypothetical protein
MVALLAKVSKAEKAAIARAEYIKTALVIIQEGIALVRSQEEMHYYMVHFDGLVAKDCECGDHTYRHAHCKHQEAVELRLAPKPKKVRRSAKNTQLVAALQLPEGVKVRKVRGQAVVKVIAPEKEVMIEEVMPDAAPVVSAECPVNVASVTEECHEDDTLSTEEEALFADVGNDEIVLQDELKSVPVVTIAPHPALSKPVQGAKFSNQQRRNDAPLNGNHGFRRLR